MEEQKILSIDEVRFEINYKTSGISQEILRIIKKFTDDILYRTKFLLFNQ